MAGKGKLTGTHVLIMIIAFFGVLIAVNAIFVSAALKTYPGVSEKKSYFQGLKYNDTLAERAAQAELGWRVSVTTVDRTGAQGRVVIAFSDAEKPISRLAVTGFVKRPVHDGDDQALVFEESAAGVYEAQIAAFAPGLWDLTVRAENDKGDVFDADARIIAP